MLRSDFPIMSILHGNKSEPDSENGFFDTLLIAMDKRPTNTTLTVFKRSTVTFKLPGKQLAQARKKIIPKSNFGTRIQFWIGIGSNENKSHRSSCRLSTGLAQTPAKLFDLTSFDPILLRLALDI